MTPEQIEAALKKEHVDPEALEETFDPLIHKKLELYLMEHKKHAGHGIKHTHIEHHHDGSHTITQHHEDGTSASSAKGDLDQVHDHLEDTIGQPNAGEAEANAGPAAAAPAMAAPVAPGM